jgi:2'-hydroxyisoflavone reductase
MMEIPGMTTRRQFLNTAAVASGSALIAQSALPDLAWGATPSPMNILILGGTGYIGPHLVRLAVSRGHKVTTFTRGRRKPELPPEVIQLIGDRNGQLQALEGKTWDAVIDDSATNPEWVRLSTELLKGKAPQYLFTSSTGVYYPYLKRGLDETTMPHTTMVDPKDGSESFGVQKAQCEEIVRAAFGKGSIVVRPSYIVGPGDTSDRFPYWPQRLAKGGLTLAPGKKSDPVQMVDVRDLVAFDLKLLEERRGGPTTPRDLQRRGTSRSSHHGGLSRPGHQGARLQVKTGVDR